MAIFKGETTDPDDWRNFVDAYLRNLELASPSARYCSDPTCRKTGCLVGIARDHAYAPSPGVRHFVEVHWPMLAGVIPYEERRWPARVSLIRGDGSDPGVP